MQMFILICPIFFAFLPLPSKGENLSLCFSQFKSLFFNSKISTVLHTEERAHTVFCQLPYSANYPLLKLLRPVSRSIYPIFSATLCQIVPKFVADVMIMRRPNPLRRCIPMAELFAWAV
uniref:Secreted protein n=1 Tax=Globodera rostochiensis TaxID=31243 RepID=A0A914IBZ8_GLORO